MTPRKHDLWLTKCKNRVLRGPIDSERSVDVRDQASNMPRLIRMLGATATKVGPMSLARNSQRCASTTRGLPTAQENADSRAGKICGHSVAQHRLPGARSSGGRGLARPVVPGGVSLLAVLVSIRSSVVTSAASIAMTTATAKSTTAVRWLFGSLLMREPPLQGKNVMRLEWFPARNWSAGEVG